MQMPRTAPWPPRLPNPLSLQARWFIKHTLPQLRELCDANPGYGVLLVGHSLGAGVLRGGKAGETGDGDG